MPKQCKRTICFYILLPKRPETKKFMSQLFVFSNSFANLASQMLTDTFSHIDEGVYTLCYVLYAMTILSTILVIITENRNPVKSLSWVLVLIFLPLVGLILYLFFGQNLHSKRMVSRRTKRKLRQRDYHSIVNIDALPLSLGSRQTIRLCHGLCSMPYHSGNQVKIFTSGKEKFEQYVQDLENAQEYIHIQYYIIEDDKIGNRIKKTLIQCAKRGVEVRFLYDDVGCWSVKPKFFKEMLDTGIQTHPFLEITFPQLASRINNRNHRKITVIDGKIGYIGGMNIADRYLDGLKWGTWRDTHLRIEGPAVQGLQMQFAVDWSYECKEILSDSHFFPVISPQGNSGIQIASGGPMGEWSNIAMLFLKAITTAKKYVYIQTPYFLPTESLSKALQAAALSKVDVRIMIPRRSDSQILRYASFSYISEMLKAGVKVYFYQPGLLHAKTIVVDEEMCSVGSTNFDFRSFEHNFEANAFIYDPEVNSEMRRIFIEDQQQCERIILHNWRRRPFYQKGFESLMRLLSPIL